MPEQKKYLIEIPDMPEGSGIWDAAKWERHKDAFMKKYPTANVFEVGQYDANDTDENDQFMLTFENDPESSGIWDASKWERHKDAFTAKYPDAQVNRVRYVDYWGDAAKQNRARREELNQPDPERDARLAEIGYFDDVSGERKQFDMNSPAAMGLKPVSSAIKQNSVSGETEYLDPKVAEFYANDTAYTERLAERARLDAEYESNPSVVAERKWLAEMEKEKAAYVSKMREETQAAMEKNVDKSAWARGYSRKHNPGVATSFATSGDYSREALAGSLANEKAENYKSAMAYWDKAERVRKEHTTFAQGAKNVAKNWWEEYQSQDDIETFAEVTSILKRLEKEHGNLNEISDEAIEKSLTEDEKYLVRSFFEYNSAMAEAGADMTKWYKGGQIAAEAVPFMLEILATGGLYKAAGDAAVGAARKGLAKWIMKSAKGSVARAAKAKTAKVLTSKAGQGIISALAGTAARTAVAPGTYTRMAEATTHIDDEGHLNIVKNMGVAAVDAYIENLSEESGIIFKKLFGIAGKGVKELGKALGGNTFARMGQTLGKNSVMQAIAKGYNTFMPKLEALGFHGLPEEIGEEILGNALREATFVQPGALKEMFVDGNFGTMLIGFAPMTILGAAGSAANIGYVNMEAARMGKQLRERMSGHYRDEQINLLMSGIQSAENAQQVQEAISPIIAAIERRKDSGEISVQQALADVKAVYDYGMLVAKNKAMLFAQGEQNRELADAQRAKLFDTYGKFWREDAKGNQLVQTARLNDGRSVFVLSEPAEDGKITIIDMKDGKKGFANTSDIAQVEVEGKEEKQSETATRSLDRYIDGVIASQTQSAEAVRMGNERNAQIDALRSRITEGTKINLGTEGSPVIVIARGTTREGVRVVDSTGAESLLGWEQAADALGTPIKVKTDKELVDEEIAAIAKRNEERRRRSQVSSQSSQQTSQQVATDAANTVQEENKHIPLNEDGTVNEAAFWEQSPEEYAAWNDEQNQDGGADTLEQIANAKNELATLVAQAQSAVMTSNPATRKAAKREVQRLQERLARIEALEQKYLDRAVAPYRQRAQMWMKQTGAQIHLVETEEELAKISTSAAQQSAAGGIVRGLAKDGKAYIYLPGITSESEVDEVFMHETVAHLGLLGLLGQQKYDELCAQVWQMMSEEARRTFLSYAGGQKGPLAAADEYIAHIAERIGAGVAEETELTVWEKIMEIVRNFLRELGFNITMTEQELSALLTAAYADLAKNMKSAEQIAGQKKESREAEAKESRSKTEMKYAELAETLTPEEIVAVAYNDYNAAKEAYEAHRKNSLEVMSGESSKSYVERKKAYLDELAKLKDQLKEEEAFVDLVARTTIEETGAALELLTLQRSGFEVDEQNDDARFSVRYLPTMEQRVQIIDSIVEVTGQPRDVAERWLDSELSLASIVLNDKEYLDYAPDAKYKAIKDNSDYPQGTVDFNNICRKRKDFTRMYTRLQRAYPNRIFTAEDLADIRTIMSEDGLTVACGLCYVEDRRQKLGEVANAFIEDLQNGFRNYAKKNETKRSNAAQFMVLVGGDTYVPSIYDLITLEGSDKLYEEHRGIWEAFGAYNRARGQQTQNTFQGYAEYKREILSWSDAKVKKVNSLGGLRIFSYSDFEAHHLLDIVQIIIDCAARGVMIQGYTKVPEFARVVEKTGIKLNRSLIPLGDTGIVDGKLAYDPVEGIDINDPNFLESNDNVGNILIGINDEQIRLAMADPFIHYIIPYHARQAGTIRAKLNVGAWTNYIDVQNERDINTGKRVKDNINIYTEVLDESITNDRQFVEKYLDVCREKGFIPKFDQFLDKDAEGNYVYTPGYYKFLVDFKLFDEAGNILPQKPVVAQFDDAFNAQILEDYAKDEKESTGNQMNATYDRLVSALNLGPAEREDVRFSIAETPEEWDRMMKIAEDERGYVFPGLHNIQFPVVKVGYHTFRGKTPHATTENARQFLKSIQGTKDGVINGRKVKLTFNSEAVGKLASDDAIRTSKAKGGYMGGHLAVVENIFEIIEGAYDVEIHPNIKKINGKRDWDEGLDRSILIHRYYAAVSVEGDEYRVMILTKEYRPNETDHKIAPYTVEVEAFRLERTEPSKVSAGRTNHTTHRRSNIDGFVSGAKLLKGVEKSYDPGVKVLDVDYLRAVEAGDMETAQRMVIEAARLAMPNTKVVDENGNPKVVYHGGSSAFTKFDTSLGDGMTDLGQGSYFSSIEEIAREYTVPNGDNQWQIDNYIEEHPYLREMSRTQLGLAEAERIAIGEVFKNAKVYPVFLNMENPYYTTMEDFASGEFAHLYNRDGLRGYDGIIDDTFKDRFEDFAKGAVQYVAFEPSQIKSADPVTYDDNGNAIPLSQRFKPEEEDIRFSIRTKPAPKKTGIGYKVFYLKDGKLYPPMVANQGGVDTPVGVWLDAEEGTRAGVSKTGRPKVKQGGKGTQGGSGTLAYRPGWHLGEIPYAIQFNRKDENGDRTLFPADFVWAEVEYANDVDYQEEAMSYGMNANGKFQHSLAGLPKLPTDGSYRYRTNPNPETDPWIITGAMKVNRILTPSEVDQMVIDAGREPQKRQEGAVTDEQIEALNEYFFGAFAKEEVRMSVDSRGNTLTPEQEAFFANSKAVDKDGNLLVLYHGTPRAGFTEFKSGWFTTSKEDAVSYSGDRKGRLFDPNEQYVPEVLEAGDFKLGYMTFDSEADRDAFLAEYPEAAEAMSEREFDQMTLEADEEYDDLIARKPELQKIWEAYREYERDRMVVTTIADVLRNPRAYTEEDIRRAIYAIDFNTILDSVDEIDNEMQRKTELFHILNEMNEDADGSYSDIKVPTRVPRNGKGVAYNDASARTYEVYINVEHPYEIDANGRGSEFESGNIYKAVEEALADEQYDGVIVRNWRVGRTQQLGDVVVPKNGSQIKLTSNVAPTEDSDIRFSVNENPTEAQKEAGNYKMGHLNLDGYRITIENPKGSVRRGTDSKGNAWENTLNNDYGYIRGTEGVDGDHIDVYLSDNPSEGNVFVIDQVNPETREFDEHKVMYGFNSAEEAREAYLANFSEGWNGLGTITEVSKDEFKKWIQSSHRKTKPFSEYKSVNAISSQSEGGKAEERNELTAEEKMAINGLFPGAFAEDEDVRFSIRRTDETAEEFTQRAIDDYRSRYAEIVPMHLVEASSRKSVAAAFGVEEDELPEDIYQNVLRRYELGDVGFYFPGEDKFIIIFARDEIRDGKELEDALIHENIHALINTRTNAPLRAGKWLYDNPVDKVMRDIKDAVIAKYPADRHYEEMLTNWLAPYMVLGGSRKALEKLPVEYRPYIQYIYNELGYDSEREDKRRRAAGAGSASVSGMEPTKMSGSTPSEGGTRKGLERNEAKERPRVVWGKPETDKDTRLSYVPAPGEIELAATKGIATLTYFNVGFDEMRRIFEESISSEEQNIARINEKPTKTAYDMERLRRAERELMASQMRLNWWNSVNDRLINKSLVEADVKSALQDTEPRNIAEYLSQFFTMRVDRVNSYGVDKDGKPVVRKVNKKVGVMLTPETLEKELGWSSKDWSGIGYIVSAKDGRSLDAIAEMISEDADAQPFIAGMDTMDIKNEIISFIQSVGSYTEIRDYIKNERAKEAQGLAGYVNGKIQERINGIEESTGMSVDEYNARIISEAIAEVEDSLVSLETSEIFGNFEQLTNDDYEGYIEAVSRGEDGGAYEGAEDLSEAGDYGGRVDSENEGEPEDGDSDSGRDDSGSVGDRPGEAGGDGVPPIGHKAKGVVPASVPLDTEGMSVDEIVREGKMKAAAENADAAESFIERINRINNALAQLRSALAAQRSYDKDTVRIITNLANDLLQGGRLSDMTRGEIKRLLSVIKDAVGKEDLSVSVDRLMDIMIANQLRFGKSRFEEFLKIKATKVNASGVEARGKLDVAGQQMMQYLKEGIASSMTDEMLSERIATEENNLDSESEVIRGNAENKLVGYYLARLYRENIKASEAEEKDLREEIKDAKVQYDAGMMDKVAYKEFIDSCYEAIRENRMQRVNAFESLNAALAEKIAGSIIAGKMLADAEKARIERIHHFANSDMEGMPSVQQGKVKGGFWNNTVLRFLFKPLATFDQMLRSFAPKSRSGEGYLWNHFMGGWLKASENEFKGIQKAHEMLDEKVRSVFKEAKRWSDLFAIEKRMPTMDVKFWDGEKMADFKLTQGNLLYIYMVSKMTDGKMKLSKMGITDVDVRNMVAEMDPRFIELADWIQESFLPALREKYNEVHVRLFGAPMAAIDNYFPIRVLANARTREVDLAVEESSSKPSTITGSIIKRTKNSLALDILGSDAFDVVLEHIEQMEHWAAFAEFNKDLNTLLSYNKFRNRVQNSRGIYGAGTVAWNNFRAVAEIAAGVYKPAVKSDSLDKLITNIAKGVTGAKISFRVYTALKQFLSAPAFVSDASAVSLIKSLSNPYKAWTWAMNELPLFEKRWKSRQAGDSRLMETEADWELWKNKIVELAGRYGMTPNAFVDALTVSIGARAIYETKLKEYLDYGYSPERAEEKAKRDATVLFNESQQSNESAFLSAAQVDRTVASILITVFRNSSMGYQRMYVDGIRNLKHMLKRGYREQSIEFMKKQMVRDGLEEDKAARAAERIYNRSFAKNAARVATFGFLVQFAWNLGPYMAYLLMGDDDEEKKDMITDAAVRGVVGGPVEGLAAGQVISTILGDVVTGEDISEPTLELPATSDLENAFNQLKSDPVRAVNDMFNLLVQSGIGVNPQTITDAIVAIVDACNGDMETSKEVAFALMRILQTPQSQIDKLYKEEIGFAEDEGLDLRIHEFAERYAKYKVTRNAPLAKWLYSDEREKELEDRFIKRFLNDAEDLKRSQGSEEAKTFYEYYDVEYKKIPQTLRDLRKQAKENPYRSESLSKEANRILETDEFKLYEEVLPHIKMYEHHKKQMKEAPDGFTRAEEEIKMREEMEAVVEILRGREQE